MKPLSVTSALTVLTAGMLGLVPATALAQSPLWGAASGMRIGVGAYRDAYTFTAPRAADVRTLTLNTLTFGARIPLLGRSTLSLSGNYGAGSLVRADGRELTISGLTDTELRLGVPIEAGSFTTSVTGILVLPTGHASHSQEEAQVANAIAADLLPFRISHWGSGGGAGVNVGAIRPFNGGSIGLSAGYLVAREFEPSQAEQFVYRPGNQLQVRAAMDRVVGGTGKITLSLLLQRHGEDLRDGTNLYRAGNRYQAMGSYAFAVGARASGIVYAGGLHREQGTALLDLSGEMPRQNLILAGGGLRMSLAGGVLLPSVDTRLFRSGDGKSQGYLAGLGASWERQIGSVTLVPSLRARFGQVLVWEGSESGMTGADLGLSVRFGLHGR